MLVILILLIAIIITINGPQKIKHQHAHSRSRNRQRYDRRYHLSPPHTNQIRRMATNFNHNTHHRSIQFLQLLYRNDSSRRPTGHQQSFTKTFQRTSFNENSLRCLSFYRITSSPSILFLTHISSMAKFDKWIHIIRSNIFSQFRCQRRSSSYSLHCHEILLIWIVHHGLRYFQHCSISSLSHLGHRHQK